MRATRTVGTAVVLAAVALQAAGCSGEGPTGTDEVGQALSPPVGDLDDFTVIELDGDQISADLQEGQVTLPFRTRTGERRNLELEARRLRLRAPELTEGVLRSGPETSERVPLPPEQNFEVGPCPEEGPFLCGAVTLLGEEQPMVRAMIIHPELGVAFVEPVDQLMQGEADPAAHVMYHATDTTPIELEGDVLGTEESTASGSLRGTMGAPAAATFKESKIVLDGDVAFYKEDPSTVWRRQESVFNLVRLILAWVGDGWSLVLDIKGQEAWVANGPSQRARLSGSPTVNPDKLFEILTDPNYFLVHPVNDQEFTHLYMGQLVGGKPGKAAGIGNTSALGGQAGYNHSVSMVSQCSPRGGILCSVRAKAVVMAHELGHVLGGEHEDGTSSGPCSPSLMLPGGAAQAQNRSLCFSQANDNKIEAVIRNVLP